MKRECTYCLTDDGVFDSIDAASKHSEGQRCVETEVEQHMPSLPTDPDCTAKKKVQEKKNELINSDKYHTVKSFMDYLL